MLLLKAPCYSGAAVGVEGGIVLREIARQSLAMAVWDEFGLPTRDGALCEPFPEAPGPENEPMDITVRPCKRRPSRILVWREPDDTPDDIAVLSIPPGGETAEFDYIKYLREVATVTQGPFLDALRAVGFRGEPIRTASNLPLPKGIEVKLRRMDFLSQFTAVRILHDAIRSEGGSSARFAALARGYAHLGKLTEFHWNATPKIFQARSLLYAQRLVTMEPESPWGLWNRAYVCAWLGMHAVALEDLAAARAMQGEQDDASPLPRWVEMIDAHCRYDAERLAEIATEQTDQSAAALLLRFVTVEHWAPDAVRYEAAAQALEKSPACLRVVDAMCEIGPLGSMRNRVRLLGRILDPFVKTPSFSSEGTLGGGVE